MSIEPIKTTLTIDGEAQYKNAIAEAKKSIQVFASEARAATSALATNGTEMERERIKAQSLAKQYEAQGKVVQLMQQRLKDLTGKYGENSKKVMEQQIQLNNAITKYNDLGKAMQKAEEDAKSLGDALSKTMDGADKQMAGGFEQSRKGLKDLLNDSRLVFAGIAAASTTAAVKAGAQIYGIAVDSGQWADDLATRAAVAGVGTKTMQGWEYASRFIDVSPEALESAVKQIRKRTMNGEMTDEMQAAYASLYTMTRSEDGKYRDPVDVLFDTIRGAERRLNEGMGDNEVDALLQKALGLDFSALRPLLNAGVDAWDDRVKEGEERGFYVDDQGMETLGLFDDTRQEIDAAKQALSLTVGEYIAGASQAAQEAYRDLLIDAVKAVEGDEEAQQRLSEDLAELIINVFSAAGKIVGGTADAIQRMAANENKQKLEEWVEQHSDGTTSGRNALQDAIDAVTAPTGAVARKIAKGLTAEYTPELPEDAADIMQNELQSAANKTDVVVPVSFSPVNSVIDAITAPTGAAAWALAEKIPGHANGLEYVPWDNYLAFLHKGERVQTATEAAAYRSGKANTSGLTAEDVVALTRGVIRTEMSNVHFDVDGRELGSLIAGSVSEIIADEIMRG